MEHILEHLGRLLELLRAILEQVQDLLAHLLLILEDHTFIRTFKDILEQFTTLLEHQKHRMDDHAPTRCLILLNLDSLLFRSRLIPSDP